MFAGLRVEFRESRCVPVYRENAPVLARSGGDAVVWSDGAVCLSPFCARVSK